MSERDNFLHWRAIIPKHSTLYSRCSKKFGTCTFWNYSTNYIYTQRGKSMYLLFYFLWSPCFSSYFCLDSLTCLPLQKKDFCDISLDFVKKTYSLSSGNCNHVRSPQIEKHQFTNEIILHSMSSIIGVPWWLD